MGTTTAVTSALSGIQWTIEGAGQRAVVVEVGGGLRTYAAAGVELLDGYAEEEVCPGGAGQVLAPWPNRIRDGQYAFGGKRRQLSLSEPARHNAIHGLTRWARWRPVAVVDDSITVEHELAAHPGYPWPLLLTTRWSLGPGGLTAEHSATNVGDQSCPFGLGAHPYLRLPGVPVEELRLQVPARCRLLVDGRMLPIGAARIASSEYDYTKPRAIGDAVLDIAFGEVERDADGGSAVCLSTVDGRGVRVWADRSFGWWQVFTGDTLPPGRHRRSVAIEPMTCPPDAFRSGRDVVVIEPGDTWRGSWGISPL